MSKRRSAKTLAAEEFGRRLMARLDELGWNQSDLARRVTALLSKPVDGQIQGHEFGRDRISNYVRGQYLPRRPALNLIAKAVKLKPSDLLPEEVVPSTLAVDDSPLSEFKMLPDGRCGIRLNRVVSQRTATAIMTLLSEENSGA